MFVTADLRPNKQDIINNSHNNNAKELCRKYIGDDLLFAKIPFSNFRRLAELIQKEIDELLTDNSYDMIGELKVKELIKKNKDGIFLRISGSYFGDREGISFYFSNNFVGFCGEMSGCNQTPFIIGFLNWIDELNDD
jgi:hypothetical protein